MKILSGVRHSICVAVSMWMAAGLLPVSLVETMASANGAGQGASNGVGTDFELSFWQSVATSDDRAQLEAYLTQYPNGTFSGLARAKIAALSSSFAQPLPPVAAPPMAAQPAPAPPAAAAPAAVVAPAPAPSMPVATPPAAPQPVIQQAVITSAAVAAPSLLDQMAALGQGGMTSTTALFTETGPVPARPALTPLTNLAMPDHFCSAVERNAFHDRVYVPAIAQADRNNEATIAHLKSVQSLHAQAMAAKNISGANALAREATAFKPVAEQAYQDRTAMADLFTRIMTIPVTGC